MGKHAYLIIANRNFHQLAKLVHAVDDERNDIYIQIDSTSKEARVPYSTSKSELHILPELPIYWGDYSQVEAELVLLSVAASKNYEYYHILSGLDLPLANQDTIHDFFSNHPGKQFVTFSSEQTQKQLLMRTKPHLFRHHYRGTKHSLTGILLRIYRKVETLFLGLTVAGQNKAVDEIEFGSNWVSLSNDFVQQIVAPTNQRRIRAKFSKGYLVDELFIPFELHDLGYRNTVYYDKPVTDKPEELQGNLRYINWWDGTPHTWRYQDVNQLVYARKLGHFFSRKFDETVDSKIIDWILRSF